MRMKTHEKKSFSVKFYLRRLFYTYLSNRLLLPPWCYGKERRSIKDRHKKAQVGWKQFEVLRHNQLTEELKNIFEKEIEELKILITIDQNKYLKEILHFKLHKLGQEKILKKEYKKGMNLFKKAIKNLKPLKYKNMNLVINKNEESKINIKVFNKKFSIEKNQTVSIYRISKTKGCVENTDALIEEIFDVKIDILVVPIGEKKLMYSFVDKTEKVVFKFPTEVVIEEKNSVISLGGGLKSIKSLRFPLNKNSLIKTADKKSRVFDEEFILQVKDSERVVTDFTELNALHNLNEKAKKDSLFLK